LDALQILESVWPNRAALVAKVIARAGGATQASKQMGALGYDVSGATLGSWRHEACLDSALPYLEALAASSDAWQGGHAVGRVTRHAELGAQATAARLDLAAQALGRVGSGAWGRRAPWPGS
jgi:hypothetical protein